MRVEEWLGKDNKLGADIWHKKYQFDNETFDQWLNRVSGGDEELRQIIKDRKFFSHRDKDVLDLRQIDLFENYYGHIEQEKIFKEQIIQEQKRRGLITKESYTPNISIDISQKTNINKKKLPRWLGKIICLFIPKAKNRKHFRKKYVIIRN